MVRSIDRDVLSYQRIQSWQNAGHFRMKETYAAWNPEEPTHLPATGAAEWLPNKFLPATKRRVSFLKLAHKSEERVSICQARR
jgi:hypothetical protein